MLQVVAQDATTHSVACWTSWCAMR